MFRELERKHKALSAEDCIDVLKTETRGVLSVLGDDDYPYGTPINHYYDEESGSIFFHVGTRNSHRTDALKKHNKVSFCVFDKGVREEGRWAYKVRSVIVFGKIEMTRDIDKITEIATKLSHKFTQDDEYIDEYIKEEIRKHGHRTLLLELKPEHIRGKLVTES